MKLPKTMRLPDLAAAELGLHTPLGRYLNELGQCLQGEHRAIRDEIAANTKTGTLVLDDGANWRLTLTFYDGKLTAVTTAASTSAEASWTDG